MTRGLRWRVFVLQLGLIGILGFVAAFAFGASSFASSSVHDNLAAQQVYFPPSGSAALAALPAADAAAMNVYAGQQLTTGAQAETYADHFIAVHLQAIAGGQTYAQVSAASQAHPTDTKLAAQVQTLFRGETLRGLLLNSYGFATIGQYGLYAAVGLAIAAGAVFVALLYELFAWRAATRRTATGLAAVAQRVHPQPV
jgi:hypothetical protein